MAQKGTGSPSKSESVSDLDVLNELNAYAADEEKQEDETLQMLRRQLATVQAIRQDIGRKDMIIQTLNERCELLSKEKDEIVPQFQKNLAELNDLKANRDSLLSELETLRASHEALASIQAKQATELRDEKIRAKEFHFLSGQLQMEIADLRTATASLQHDHTAAQSLIASLQKEAKTRENQLQLETNRKKVAEKTLEDIKHRADKLEQERKSQAELLAKLTKQRDKLQQSGNTFQVEARQWQTLYQDLEQSIVTYRASAAATQQKHHYDIASLNKDLATSEQHAVDLEAKLNSTKELLAILAETIDTIVSSSPRARSAANAAILNGREGSGEEGGRIGESDIVAYRADLRAIMGHLHRTHTQNHHASHSPSIHPPSQDSNTHFSKIVSFMNDVILDSLNVQEETASMRRRLEVASDAIENATGLLSRLEEQLEEKRGKVRAMKGDERKIHGVVEEAWVHFGSGSHSNGGARSSGQYEDNATSSSDSGIDRTMPPLQALVRLLGVRSVALEQVSAAHQHVLSQHSSMQHSLDSLSDHYESALTSLGQHAAAERHDLENRHTLTLDTLLRDHAMQMSVAEELRKSEHESLISDYKRQLSTMREEIETDFADRVAEVCCMTAQQEQEYTLLQQHTRKVERQAGLALSAIDWLCAKIRSLEEEAEIYGPKGAYGEVVRRLLSRESCVAREIQRVSLACTMAPVPAPSASASKDTTPFDSIDSTTHEKAEPDFELPFTPHPPVTLFSHAVYMGMSASFPARTGTVHSTGTRLTIPSLRVITLLIIAANRFKLLMQGKKWRGGGSGTDLILVDEPMTSLTCDALEQAYAALVSWGAATNIGHIVLHYASTGTTTPPALHPTRTASSSKHLLNILTNPVWTGALSPLPEAIIERDRDSMNGSFSHGHATRLLSTRIPLPTLNRIHTTLRALQALCDDQQHQMQVIYANHQKLYSAHVFRQQALIKAQEDIDSCSQTIDLLTRRTLRQDQDAIKIALAHSRAHSRADHVHSMSASPTSHHYTRIPIVAACAGRDSSPSDEGRERLGSSGSISEPPPNLVSSSLTAANIRSSATSSKSSSPHAQHPNPIVSRLVQATKFHPSSTASLPADDSILQIYQDLGRMDQYRNTLNSYRVAGLDTSHRPTTASSSAERKQTASQRNSLGIEGRLTGANPIVTKAANRGKASK